MFFSLSLSIFVGLVHYFSRFFKPKEGENYYRIFSFSAGISISYLFLDLFPHTYSSAEVLKNWVFVFLLLGFTMVHFVEKFFYQHDAEVIQKKKLRTVHMTTFFFYYFMIGIVLVDIVQREIYEGIIFIIPVALHAGLSSASIALIHGQFKESTLVRVFLSLAVPGGVCLAFLFPIPHVVHSIAISGIAGILLYVFVKDFIPEGENGQPLFFFFGLVLFSGLIGLLKAVIL